MKKLIPFIAIFIFANSAFSQNLNGMWRGFYNTNGDVTTYKTGTAEFILDIKIDGVKVSGHSYTFFNKRKEYIICKIEGTYKEQSKTIEVIETKVVKKKASTFDEVVYQKNVLKYSQSGNIENLGGVWVDAKNPKGDGGKTNLQRYLPVQKDDPSAIISKNVKKQEVKEVKKDSISSAPINYTNGLITKKADPIEVKSDSITVAIYDNGEIDGDTASFIFNGKMICEKRMISNVPIIFKLKLDELQDNELVFIPNNEGAVSPNTGLAVIYDSGKRKEVWFRGKKGEATVYKIINNNKNLATIK
jgi:hypothetical protein